MLAFKKTADFMLDNACFHESFFFSSLLNQNKNFSEMSTLELLRRPSLHNEHNAFLSSFSGFRKDLDRKTGLVDKKTLVSAVMMM